MPANQEEAMEGIADFGKFVVKMATRLIIAAVVILGITVMPSYLFEHLDAQHIMVIQSPVSGNLVVYTTPGIKWQNFGGVTKYPKRGQYWFSSFVDQGSAKDQSIKVRFNDGAHAQISGSVSYDLPMDEKQMWDLHQKYGSAVSVDQQLIRTVVEKALYMTGPLMSSKESYAEKRNELIRYIDDQINNGIYRTETYQVQEKDPMTGDLKTVTLVRLVEKNGRIEREETSPLAIFGVRTFNLSINRIDYDEAVEKQIQAQQALMMQVQTAIAEAKKAEQAAITAEKNGQAEAAKAKWGQEAIKAQAVTEAEQRLAVAGLDRQTAEQRKLEQILLGEGEANRRKLVMEADGALDKKLDAYIKVNQMYADALKNIQVPIVPSIQMGQSGGNGQTGAQTLIDLLQAKTAKELALDALPAKKQQQ
jgi:regulator of protease activity HflC (stomatin/prohibitin superfamily)